MQHPASSGHGVTETREWRWTEMTINVTRRKFLLAAGDVDWEANLYCQRSTARKSLHLYTVESTTVCRFCLSIFIPFKFNKSNMSFWCLLLDLKIIIMGKIKYISTYYHICMCKAKCTIGNIGVCYSTSTCCGV